MSEKKHHSKSSKLPMLMLLTVVGLTKDAASNIEKIPNNYCKVISKNNNSDQNIDINRIMPTSCDSDLKSVNYYGTEIDDTDNTLTNLTRSFSFDEFNEKNHGNKKTNCVNFNLFKKKKVVKNIFSFLPWRKVLVIRTVSKVWYDCSKNFLSFKKISDFSDNNYNNSNKFNNFSKINNNKNSHDDKALFIPCNKDFSLIDNSLRSNSDFLGSNFSSSKRNGKNYNCGQLSNSEYQTRIFFGQLRRDATVEFLYWVFDVIFDISRSSIAMVENHTDRSTGKGKGCAWVTVLGKDNASKLLKFHHKAFYDIVEGVEGMWISNKEEVLASLSKDRSNYKNHRFNNNSFNNHPKHMPRSSLVIEASASGQQPQAHPLKHHVSSDSTSSFRSISMSSQSLTASSFSSRSVESPELQNQNYFNPPRYRPRQHQRNHQKGFHQQNVLYPNSPTFSSPSPPRNFSNAFSDVKIENEVSSLINLLSFNNSLSSTPIGATSTATAAPITCSYSASCPTNLSSISSTPQLSNSSFLLSSGSSLVQCYYKSKNNNFTEFSSNNSNSIFSNDFDNTNNVSYDWFTPADYSSQYFQTFNRFNDRKSKRHDPYAVSLSNPPIYT